MWQFLILCLLLPAAVHAATYSATPSTIRSVLARMGAGDTVELQSGSYGALNNSQMRIPSGTSWQNAPVIKAAPGADVQLKGLALSGSQQRYLVVDGVKINAQRQGREAVWISEGAGYVRVQNSEITGGTAHGVLLPKTGAGGNEFLGVNVHGNGTRSHFDHGLYISSANNTVANSSVHNNAGYGVHVYASGDQTANHNLIWHNRIEGNGTRGDTTYGMLLQDGTGNAAIGNTLSNNGTGDIQVGERTRGTILQGNQTSGNNLIRGAVTDQFPGSGQGDGLGQAPPQLPATPPEHRIPRPSTRPLTVLSAGRTSGG